MGYQIKCDDYLLHDLRLDDEKIIVLNPKCTLEVNTVGTASFMILSEHPNYGVLKKMRSIFEILQDGKPIFRGRMTGDTRDFDNTKLVDLEGLLAFFNDSVVKPFVFPDDFLNHSGYKTAAASGNVVEFFLKWLIDQHNEQVQEFQRLKLGKVTVSDPNNYISRSTEEYLNTWEVLKTRLFDSSLGGYLCIRYEADGNYVDYLQDFEFTNSQPIEYGENLLDLSFDSDASATYSAIIPVGAEVETEYNYGTAEGEYVDFELTETVKEKITISGLPDGNITDDIVKKGDVLYSKSAVEQYGWICAPVSETTWDDVTEAGNLQSKGVDFLTKKAIMLTNTITIKAFDLHFSDEEIEAFRIYGYVSLLSKPHDQEDSLKLTKLEIDIQNPQNTIITLGEIRLSLTDINAGIKRDNEQRLEDIIKIVSDASKNVNDLKAELPEKFTSAFKQFADEITLEITGSLGSTASIVMTAGGVAHQTELELSNVREAFANDDTAITISAGLITFNSGTIVINSTNFLLDSSGNVEVTGKITATSGRIGSADRGWKIDNSSIYHGSTFASASAFFCTGSQTELTIAGHTDSGWVLKAGSNFGVTKNGHLYCTSADLSGTITTESGSYIAKLHSGGLELYYDEDIVGKIDTRYHTAQQEGERGVAIRLEGDGKYLMFCTPHPEYATSVVVEYYLNNGMSDNYDERHIFQTSARFLDKVYFSGSGAYFRAVYLYENSFIRTVATDGTVGEEMLGFWKDEQRMYFGSNSCTTMLRGSTVYLKNTSTTVTSDRNAKNSIEALPEAYETFIDALDPVRFKYNEGTSGRYHVGYIAQDVEAALASAGLSTQDFAGYVDIDRKGELGLIYTEFIALLHRKIKKLEQRINEMESVNT